MKYISIFTRATFLLMILATIPAEAADEHAASAPVATSMLACEETTIGLDRTAHFKVPSLSCGTETQKKQLWLDGMDTGVRSIGCEESSQMLTFNVGRDGTVANELTGKAWITLLRDPLFSKGKGFDREVEVTLKNDNGSTLAHQTTNLRILENKDLWPAAAIVVAAAILLWIGYNSGMLRDSGTPPGGGARPFSLARVQMVWWFSIVFVSYVLLWLTMHELPHIPASVLGLIGMAGGTALIAASVDKNNDDPLQSSTGFWKDITTDAHGVTLPRLQQIIWTLLFGLVFIQQMLSKLSMPDFDSSVLALMGISAGAYLGFKVPESHVKDILPPTPQPAATEDHKKGYEPT